MFRTQNEVPHNYIDKSRDFQLICRLYDLTYNNLRYEINSMPNLNDPLKINDRFLPLLATKVGFITNKNIDIDLLRYIISSFQYALKNKGSIRGIEYAVATFLRFEGKGNPVVDIVYNKEDNNSEVTIPEDIDNMDALDEFLKYILPAGCTYILQIVEKDTPRYISTVNIDDNYQSKLITNTKTDDYMYSSISKAINNNDDISNFPDGYRTTSQVSQIIDELDNYEETIKTTSKIRTIKNKSK